jgi:thiamine-monophosphate kinase
MAASGKNVGDLGESALIARLAARLPPPPPDETWSGDDAAVVAVGGDPMLFTTDLVVEGVDFRLDSFSGEDVGWKAVAVNASDIAAMGGAPRAAVATLGLKPDLPLELFDGILDGALAACRRWAIDLVGGDISEASELSIAIAMTGELTGTRPVLRTGASVGDAICVTGALGGARAGLMLLSRAVNAADEAQRLVQRQRRPMARVAEGGVLAGFASAMIDVSDGLAVDLGRVLDASAVGCDVDPGLVPVDPGIAAVTGELAVDPFSLALTGGEDYELLFTVAPDEVDSAIAAVERLGTAATRIGRVVEGPTRLIGETDLTEYKERSWDHLRIR